MCLMVLYHQHRHKLVQVPAVTKPFEKKIPATNRKTQNVGEFVYESIFRGRNMEN